MPEDTQSRPPSRIVVTRSGPPGAGTTVKQGLWSSIPLVDTRSEWRIGDAVELGLERVDAQDTEASPSKFRMAGDEVEFGMALASHELASIRATGEVLGDAGAIALLELLDEKGDIALDATFGSLPSLLRLVAAGLAFEADGRVFPSASAEDVLMTAATLAED